MQLGTGLERTENAHLPLPIYYWTDFMPVAVVNYAEIEFIVVKLISFIVIFYLI